LAAELRRGQQLGGRNNQAGYDELAC
jgi:hypothetical protein